MGEWVGGDLKAKGGSINKKINSKMHFFLAVERPGSQYPHRDYNPKLTLSMVFNRSLVIQMTKVWLFCYK